jgi:hypothetical protein
VQAVVGRDQKSIRIGAVDGEAVDMGGLQELGQGPFDCAGDGDGSSAISTPAGNHDHAGE